MNEFQFKQRIVGAIVLVALAVIFIPMLLSNQPESSIPMFGTNIPDKPESVKRLKTLELEKPLPKAEAPDVQRTPVDEHSTQSKESANKAGSQPDSQPKAKAQTAKPKPSSTSTVPDTTAKSSKTAKAWAVQAGSFSEQPNAIKLRDQIRSLGFTSFVEQIQVDKRILYRVRVGPVISKQEAESLQKQVQARVLDGLKLKGMVVSHP